VEAAKPPQETAKAVAASVWEAGVGVATEETGTSSPLASYSGSGSSLGL